MPLVKQNETVFVKVSLETSILNQLNAYSKWAKANKSAIIQAALERLFEQDTEWQEYLKTPVELRPVLKEKKKRGPKPGFKNKPNPEIQVH